MRSGAEIQHDVTAELQSEPSLDAAGIGVAVHGGVVTLSGHVSSLPQKRAAERATKWVAGVRGVADELVVSLQASAVRDDTDIAEMLVRSLKWNALVPAETVKVTVDGGWVTLEGEVEWKYQRNEAEKTVARLTGVRGVTNFIRIKPLVSPGEIEQIVHNTFRRHAELDADEVFVETSGSQVTLRGRVRSWAEYEDAEWAAWSAPGVTEVDNRLEVKPIEVATV
jgi:osmotically-inducible protein OsmY